MRGLADLLPWGALVAPGVVANKSGALSAGWQYRGPDLESASDHEVAALSQQITLALQPFGQEWMFHFDATRDPSPSYPSGSPFPDPLTGLIDEERRSQYLNAETNFDTVFTFVLTYLPPSDSTARWSSWLTESSAPATRDTQWRDALDTFRSRLADLERLLAGYLDLKRLDSAGLLTHFHRCLTGLTEPVAIPATPAYLDTLLASQDLVGGFEPRIGTHHMAVLGLTGLPLATTPALLDGLSALPFPLRISHRFLPLDARTAEKHIASYRLKWFQKRRSLMAMVHDAFSSGARDEESLDVAGDVRRPGVNRDAVEMVLDADAAISEVASGRVAYGYYTPTVILMADTRSALETRTRETLRFLRNSGFSARLETVNAVRAFLGSLPGQGLYNVRRPLVQTRNLTDLMPTTSIFQGLRQNPNPLFPSESPPLALCRTAGATPFRLNLHVEDVGHTFVAGPTGAGKSALVALLQAQFFRYPGATVFTFDKGYSSLPLAYAAGGRHYDISAPGVSSTPTFYPLQFLNESHERNWAADWLEQLLTLQGVAFDPSLRRELFHALGLLASSPSRTLTDLSVLLPGQLREALAPYTLRGAYGKLFDSTEDSLLAADSPYHVFEMSHVMEQDKRAVIPLLLYLFHRIQQRLTGSSTLIVLEEAWVFLDHPLFAERIRHWLRELRKLNASVVFVTQGVVDVLESALPSVILDSVRTKILLPNREATVPAVAKQYAALGLTQRQTEILAAATPKRDYYVISPLGRRLVDLDLGPVALAFLGSSSQEQLRQIRLLAARHGRLWPSAWLRYLNLDAPRRASTSSPPGFPNPRRFPYDTAPSALHRGRSLHRPAGRRAGSGYGSTASDPTARALHEQDHGGLRLHQLAPEPSRLLPGVPRAGHPVQGARGRLPPVRILRQRRRLEFLEWTPRRSRRPVQHVRQPGLSGGRGRRAFRGDLPGLGSPDRLGLGAA